MITANNFLQACGSFSPGQVDYVTELTEISKALGKDRALRLEFGNSTPSIWPELQRQWTLLLNGLLTSEDKVTELIEKHLNISDKDSSDDQSTEEERRLRDQCIAISRLTRNLVAEQKENQQRAFENEDVIRRVIHYYTSWAAMKNDETFPCTQMLTQTLVNMITSNEQLIGKLWTKYIALPEEQNVLVRLLASPDARTVFSTFILVLNSISGDQERIASLVSTPIGNKICISILDDMTGLSEAEEGSDGANAFDVGYEIFVKLIEADLVPNLYSKLFVADEVITPHQTTLLKLIDSYLQTRHLQSSTTLRIETHRIHLDLEPMLTRQFFQLSDYAQSAITSSIGSGQGQLVELDVMLPKVCEALVLVTQCLTTIGLESADAKELVPNLKQKLVNARVSGHKSFGIPESLIELLRLLHIFLPRINFGRPINSDNTPANVAGKVADSTGFAYLKRDLVRLLGVLAYEERGIQDRARECKGLAVVMNLCVVDERNPYIREHAIFTLNCLLEGNKENQRIVDSMQPSHRWNEEGVRESVPVSK